MLDKPAVEVGGVVVAGTGGVAVGRGAHGMRGTTSGYRQWGCKSSSALSLIFGLCFGHLLGLQTSSGSSGRSLSSRHAEQKHRLYAGMSRVTLIAALAGVLEEMRRWLL